MKNALKLLMVFLVQISSYVIAQDTASDFYNRGKAKLEIKDIEGAIEDLTKAVRLDSTALDVLKSLGDAYRQAKDYEKAEDIYENLVTKRAPPLAADYYALGIVYYMSKKYVSADSIFSKLIELKPEMIINYLWRARAKSGMDPETKEGLALRDYQTVVKLGVLNPEKFRKDLIEAYHYMQYYYYLKKEYSESESYRKKLAELEQ
jgi:tetratricopeptide (TPR) repeat protein